MPWGHGESVRDFGRSQHRTVMGKPGVGLEERELIQKIHSQESVKLNFCWRGGGLGYKLSEYQAVSGAPLGSGIFYKERYGHSE
jgi:hypothetical protein